MKFILAAAILLAATAAQAQTYTTMIDLSNNTVTTVTPNGSVTTREFPSNRGYNAANSRTTNVRYRPSGTFGYRPAGFGGYRPMGSGGYAPMGR